MKTIYKVRLGNGSMGLLRANSLSEAENTAFREWESDYGVTTVEEAEKEDIDYAVGLGAIIHEFRVPVPFVPARDSVSADPLFKPATQTVVRQNWKRVARATQLGPADTATYHLTRQDRDTYVSQHWANMPRYAKGTAPEYLTPDGEPEDIEIGDLEYKAVQRAKADGLYGVRW